MGKKSKDMQGVRSWVRGPNSNRLKRVTLIKNLNGKKKKNKYKGRETNSRKKGKKNAQKKGETGGEQDKQDNWMNLRKSFALKKGEG